MVLTLTFETTGEVRCPRRGEWFVDESGKPMMAEHHFTFTELRLLRVVDKPPIDVPAAIAGLLDELRGSGMNATADAMANDHPRVVATAKMLANQRSGYADAVEALVEENGRLHFWMHNEAIPAMVRQALRIDRLEGKERTSSEIVEDGDMPTAWYNSEYVTDLSKAYPTKPTQE